MYLKWLKCGVLLVGAAVSLALNGCRDSSDEGIEIDRERRAVGIHEWTSEEGPDWKSVGDELFEAEFLVPPTFLEVYPNSDAVDPFADSSELEVRKQSPQEVLENAGITFGEGVSAEYNPKSSILKVVQTKDQLELIEAYTCSGGWYPETRMLIRMELYEAGLQDGMDILESAQGEGDHTPEREALLRALQYGDARLVAAPSVVSRSGQRAFVGTEVPKGHSAEESEERRLLHREGEAYSLEVDAILGADGYTIDLNFAFTRHAPGLLNPDEDDELVEQDDRKVTTLVTLEDQNYVLVGSWIENGMEDAGGDETMMLLFATASLQTVGGYGAQMPTEETDE